MDAIEIISGQGNVEQAIRELLSYVGTKHAQKTYLAKYGGRQVGSRYYPDLDPRPKEPTELDDLPEEASWLDPSEA